MRVYDTASHTNLLSSVSKKYPAFKYFVVLIVLRLQFNVCEFHWGSIGMYCQDGD